MDQNTKILIPDIPGEWDRYSRQGNTSVWNDVWHKNGLPEIKKVPPERGMSAKNIEGKWYWVSDCAECNGQDPSYVYIKCEAHDVCVTCQIPRTEISGGAWGHKRGFRCKPCQSTLDAEERASKLKSVSDSEYDEYDYLFQDEIICPHCGDKTEPEGEQNSDSEECEVCGGDYSIETNVEVTYSTRVVGERVTE